MARKRKRFFSVPSPYAVLGGVIVLAAVATWLLPAGGYERVSYDGDRNVLVVEGAEGPVSLPATQSVLDSLGVRIGLEKFTSGGIRRPFATIIASEAAGVSWTVGLVGRLLMLLLGTAACIAYIVRYARRVKADPMSSLVWGVVDPATAAASRPEAAESAPGIRTKLLLGLFTLTFAVMVLGVSKLGWWFTEMTTLFLASAIVVGIIAGGGEKAFMTAFVKGAENLLGVALIIGIARGVTVVLDDGQVSARCCTTRRRRWRGCRARCSSWP